MAAHGQQVGWFGNGVGHGVPLWLSVVPPTSSAPQLLTASLGPLRLAPVGDRLKVLVLQKPRHHPLTGSGQGLISGLGSAGQFVHNSLACGTED